MSFKGTFIMQESFDVLILLYVISCLPYSISSKAVSLTCKPVESRVVCLAALLHFLAVFCKVHCSIHRNEMGSNMIFCCLCPCSAFTASAFMFSWDPSRRQRIFWKREREERGREALLRDKHDSCFKNS